MSKDDFYYTGGLYWQGPKPAVQETKQGGYQISPGYVMISRGDPGTPEETWNIPRVAPIEGTGMPATPAQFEDIEFFAGLSGPAAAAMQATLAARGYLSGNYNPYIIGAKGREALLLAYADANLNKMTLGEVLALTPQELKDIQDGSYDGPDSTSGGSSGPRTTTSTYISLSSKATAKAVLTQALAGELGREPNASEVSAFLKALNAAEEAKPTVTTTTTDGKGNTTSTTNESPVDPMARAEGYAERVDPKEARQYQTANYYDVIASMLGM